MTEPVLIAGEWRTSRGTSTFQSENPQTGTRLPPVFPVSPWSEIEEALAAAKWAFEIVSHWPGTRFAEFLECYASKIESAAVELLDLAHSETALPIVPRLRDVELPRTTGQLRQTAGAARTGSWCQPTIDTKSGIRSVLGPIGPVVVFGPNNFPFAFNGIAGGDFAAAIATGNPVIAKGHTSHPATSQRLGQLAHEAATECDMPAGFVQLVYRTSHEDGAKLVSHRSIGAVGYTGARATGLVLKQAADAAGKPMYVELSSINPVFFLPGMIAADTPGLVTQFVTSGLMAVGQFCTSPGLLILPPGSASEALVEQVVEKYRAAPAGTLLSRGVAEHLAQSVKTLVAAGATILTGGSAVEGRSCCFQNTVLRVSGSQFLGAPQALQTEAFGNVVLVVVADSLDQLVAIAHEFEGNLTGSIYAAAETDDEVLYAQLAPVLRRKVGRLLNDKMPTGVAVVSSMNHGGPFPATGHPGFTAVGVPSSLRRFGQLQCFDNVRPERLPSTLQNRNPTGQLWRWIDGQWTLGDVSAV